MLNKLYYTQQLLKLLPDNHFDHGITDDVAMRSWWQDFRSDSGLRLSLEGDNIMRELKIESWSFELPVPYKGNPRQVLPGPAELLLLNKKLTCPYFLQISKTPTLVLYGSKEATMQVDIGKTCWARLIYSTFRCCNTSIDFDIRHHQNWQHGSALWSFNEIRGVPS